MNVEDALHARRSVRAFLPRVPEAAVVRSMLHSAARAASGGNLQPWRVTALAGAPLQQLLAAVAVAEPQDGPAGSSYPPSLWEPYRSRRFDNGEDLYRTLGIGRGDKPARLAQLGRNGQFFGAPVGIFVSVDARMGLAQWADLGIYLQSLMLLAVEQGLATCAQGYWRRFGDTVAAQLALPGDYAVAFGVALGWEDTEAPINQLRATRADPGEWLDMQGF
ncbi:nitroreductase [Comamonas endophytica]|uniref:Nitroreductase n=1 Tax=Comamonas endophytica TaxID=2949090 RepID=A0ABY6G7X1_9BURK|nr:MULTISPECIES: nitroreductase [unclassified Acidovorax]MCD2511636.1 nitroreductase [Acidovorax sp. D4N7]UYG51018.1 nitroreductase [Acidovorax sp. 5MLIR]